MKRGFWIAFCSMLAYALFVAAVGGLFGSASGWDDISLPHTFVDSGIIYASEVYANDSLPVKGVNDLADTMDTEFIRFTDLSSGDSTISRLQVDTISGNPVIDSIQGMDVIRGNPDIDSISGHPLIDTITTEGNITAGDSLKASGSMNVTGGASIGAELTVGGIITTDSLSASLISTGNGYNELYAMDQNVRAADDVAFSALTLDSLTFGDDYLGTFDTGTVGVKINTNYVTVEQTGDAKWCQVGTLVTITLPTMFGTSNSNTLYINPQSTWPNELVFSQGSPVIVFDESESYHGIIYGPQNVNDSMSVKILDASGYNPSGFTASGVKGLGASTIQFLKF